MSNGAIIEAMVGCDWRVGGSWKVVRMRAFRELRTSNDVGEEGWR